MYFETGNREKAIKYKLTAKECLFGDSNFYKRAATVVLPMIIQNTLSNVVGLLDNVMIGQTGTFSMSAVAIVNQILFVFYLAIWGSLAGSGIFGTQFFGKGDIEGVHNTIRFKIYDVTVILTIALVILSSHGRNLISLYIAEDTLAADAAATLNYGCSYLSIMLIGLIPFAITQVYASAMRESGKTTLPMLASMTAMLVNFVFNALLIFGLFFFPEMGVKGAAIATVISRFVELLIVLHGAHKKGSKYVFFKGLYTSLKIPSEMIWPFMSKTLPLLANELLWSLAQATLLRTYSTRGISIIAAMNISGTISQIFNEVFLSIGNSSGIIVGQELGADRLVNARRSAWRMFFLSLYSTIVMGSLLALAAPFIPRIYKTEPEIKALATSFILVVALCMPINSSANASYFILRSGGKIIVTFLFDSCFEWLILFPAAYLLCRFTSLPALNIYLIVSLLNIIKSIIGFCLIKSGVWVRNIVKAV